MCCECIWSGCGCRQVSADSAHWFSVCSFLWCQTEKPWTCEAVMWRVLCSVWTGSSEKRAYLQQRFPQLSAEAFSNSRDTSFEQHILLHTQGRGQNLGQVNGFIWGFILCLHFNVQKKTTLHLILTVESFYYLKRMVRMFGSLWKGAVSILPVVDNTWKGFLFTRLMS